MPAGRRLSKPTDFMSRCSCCCHRSAVFWFRSLSSVGARNSRNCWRTSMWNQTSLVGKRVVVTAGGDGIGLEIARAFTEAGAKVLVCDIRPESLEHLAETLPEVHSCVADVSREAAVAAMF